MNKDQQVKIVLSAEDKTGSAVSSAQSKLGFLKKDVSDVAKVMGTAAVAGAAALGAALYSMAKAAAEAEVVTARTNATLDAMVGSTVMVGTGLKQTVTSMKLTGIEAEQMKNKIEATKLSIQEKSLALDKLHKSLTKGTISQEEYKLQSKQLNNQIESLNINLKEYSGKLGVATTSVKEIMKAHKLTAAEIEETKKKVMAAGEAAVKLGFDDETAAESVAKLYQRTGDLNKAMELNAIAMDLARAKNIDLSEASNIVGLVLSGNARALKAYGIELDETKTPLEALGELHEKVKGQAEAFTETFTGRMQVLSIQMDNFKESVGGALIEALMPFMQQLSDWAARPDVQLKIAAIAKGVGEFAAVVLPIAIETIKLFYHAWQDVVNVLGEIIFRIDQAIEKVSAFIKAVKSVTTGTVSAITSTAKSIFRADGGPVSAGSPYIVGERGPELFVPSSMGSIIPNGSLAGAGGSNIVINISGNTLLDGNAGEKIGAQIMRVLKNNLRI